MAKATTIKDALKKLEEARGVNTAELEKVSSSAELHHNCRPLAPRMQSMHAAHILSCLQIELYGQCPPIEKMDATLSTLKACK